MLKLQSKMLVSLAKANVSPQSEPFTRAIVEELMRQQAAVDSGKKTQWDITAEINTILMRELRRDIAEYRKRRDMAKRFEGKPKRIKFGPSGATDCLRKLWFRHFDAPTDPVNMHDAVQGYFMREMGSQMHMVIQVLLIKAGVLHKREVRIKPPGTCVSGFSDGKARFDQEGPRLLEIKTIGDNRLRLLGDKPADYHVAQGRLYQADHPIPLSLLYVTREACLLKEYEVPYDADAVRRALIRPHRYKKLVESRQLPVREGENLHAPPCRFCPYTQLCWGGMNLKTFIAGIDK